MNLGEGDTLLAIARNAEEDADEMSGKPTVRKSRAMDRADDDSDGGSRPRKTRAIRLSGLGTHVRSRGELTERAGRPQSG